MRKMIAAGTVLLAMGSAGQAQDTSAWAYFESDDAPLQAGVVSPDGGQLILKCDEPGSRSVFAVIVAPQALRPSTDRPQVRSLWLRWDGGNREELRWRYYDTSVMALNTSRDRNLPPFLTDLADADQLEVRFDPADGQPFAINFTVSGARDAIGRVFESCEDDNPLG